MRFDPASFCTAGSRTINYTTAAAAWDTSIGGRFKCEGPVGLALEQNAHARTLDSRLDVYMTLLIRGSDSGIVNDERCLFFGITDS